MDTSTHRTFTSVIANRGFLNLWINQILVQLSFNSLNFALLVWVFQLTSSVFAVSALFFSMYLPAVLLGLFSGVLVDVIDRKKIIILIDFFLAIFFFSLIFFKESFPAILLITFFINALGQFYSPAEASAIPIVVKKQELLTANSIFSATLYSCFLLGFGLSGPLINHLSINSVFGIGGALLFLAFLLALFFPSIKSIPDAQGKKLISALSRKNFADIWQIGTTEILETIQLIKGKLPVFSAMLILAGVQMGISVLAVLAPGFLEKSLQIKATDATYVLIIPLGLGIVVGGIVLGKFGSRLVKRNLVAKSILFAGLSSFVVGVAPFISPAIKYFSHSRPLPFFYQPPLSTVLFVGSLLIGVALISILIPSQTVLQENTPEKDRGKVFAVLGMAMAALSLIPVLLVGFLADIFGTTPIFMAMGIIIILAGIFGLKPNLFFKKENLPYRVREFLGLGHWEEKDVFKADQSR
ncbi:MAG: MFS transporter [Candidatus Daviesbacteria bacterium]|nr:MFS transporter [Candidatus Daviesbacteria bacterium]